MVRLSLFHAILALAVVSSALPTQQDAQADQGAMDAAANAAPKPRGFTDSGPRKFVY